MLVSPGCVCGLAVLGERIITHEHKPYVQFRIHLLYSQHLPAIRRLEEAFGLEDDPVWQEEVWCVSGLCDVLELLHLIEVRDVQFVQSFGDTLL